MKYCIKTERQIREADKRVKEIEAAYEAENDAAQKAYYRAVKEASDEYHRTWDPAREKWEAFTEPHFKARQARTVANEEAKIKALSGVISGWQKCPNCGALAGRYQTWCLVETCHTHLLTGEKPSEKEPRPRVVCLCGSTKFVGHFLLANFLETMVGNVVLSVGGTVKRNSGYDVILNTMTDEELSEVKVGLDKLHLRKIEMSDEVLVLDIEGYIGDSTANEIEYAQTLNKKIRYWSEEYGIRPSTDKQGS